MQFRESGLELVGEVRGSLLVRPLETPVGVGGRHRYHVGAAPARQGFLW